MTTSEQTTSGAQRELSRAINRKVAELSAPTMAAKATVAQLARQSATAPTIRHLDIVVSPEAYSGSASKTEKDRVDNAVLYSLILFARQHKMKGSGKAYSLESEDGLGASLAQLRKSLPTEKNKQNFDRRVAALLSSSSTSAFVSKLLRLSSFGRMTVNYGRLGRDLYWLQVPSRRSSVLFRWGQDYHRSQFRNLNNTQKGD